MDSNKDDSYNFDKLDRIDREIDENRIRKKDDDRLKLVETVFDEKTRLILFSMISKGFFDALEGAISTGKEANVYFATSKEESIAIKIFRIDAPSFKKMRDYIEGDYRFKKIRGKRSGFIEMWAKKEFKNLKRMAEHDIPVPQPIYVERNILLMEYLGEGDSVLPLLRDCNIKKPKKLYKNLIETVRTIYRKAKLVHADLSEYNILYNEVNEEYFIIDVSQSVLTDHPKSSQFLLRDLNNINQYFSGLGVDTIPLGKIFTWVTGFEANEILIYETLNK
jgi:RIO kinase 1